LEPRLKVGSGTAEFDLEQGGTVNACFLAQRPVAAAEPRGFTPLFC